MLSNIRGSIYLSVIAVLCTRSVAALSIKDYRKLSHDDQATYVSAAVSMLAYSYAAGGDPPRATCVKNWFFGKRGEDTPGPKELPIQIAIAEQRDPDRLYIEGVILGTIEKACPASPKPKQ